MSEPVAPASGDEQREIERRRESERRRRKRVDHQLDEALAASFPASDPVAIVTPHPEED